MDVNKLKQYIDRVIDEACKSEGRENKVRYQACLIDNNLIFAFKCRYIRVRKKIEYRLLKNLKKNFGLDFSLVMSDPLHERPDVLEATKFDLFPISCGVDPNYSVAEWTVFGKKYLIRSFERKHLNPFVRNDSGREGFRKHLQAMKDHGYDYREKHSWSDYEQAYEAAYGEPVVKITTTFTH